MVKSLQKTAKNISEVKVPHPGILDAENFDEHFELHCYKPSKDLEQFVAYFWIQRQKDTEKSSPKPLEICSGPNVYLFLTQEESFIHGTVAGEFQYNAFTPGVIAGAKFKPGGFYPFYKRPIVRLANKILPADMVFSEITPQFTQTLLKQKDDIIINTLEKVLINLRPVYDKRIDTIDRILKIVEENPLTQNARDVARVFGRSERSLQLLFHHYVGVSLKWVIVRRRLLHTIHRVRSSHDSWTSAAAEAGYSNQSHFTREFRQTIGTSPSMYLKSLQKNQSTLIHEKKNS